MIGIILLVIVTCVFVNSSQVGHLKPLGFQRPSLGHIEVTTELPDAKTFFEKYIKGSKPLVFKGAAKNIPAFSKWSDEYLAKQFGQLNVDVEEGKKENRSLNMWTWPFSKFLQKYQKEDVYLVQTLGEEMRKDQVLFSTLSCGGFSRVIQEFVMWFSSGGTNSVLHNDAIDNINCLFSGSKDMYMVDYRNRKYINMDADGSYSKVDVDAVDLNKYPGIAEAPWWEAKMETGDCMFIPYLWIHQVRSFADKHRNMAVNIWFYHMTKMNFSDCENNKDANTFTSLDSLEIGNGNIEIIRFMLKLDMEDKPEINIQKLVKSMMMHSRGGEKILKSEWKKIMAILDKNKDRKITMKEIDSITDDELKIVSLAFPGLYKSSDMEGEGEEEGDETMYEKDEL